MEEIKNETEEVKTEETTEEAKTKAKAKTKEVKEVYHCDYNKGETPTKKSDIDMQYIIDYCAGHRKYEWFVNAVDAAGGTSKKGYAFTVKQAFIDKFYPTLNVKKQKKSNVDEIYAEFKAKAKASK